jgi:membrane associated rhomboid family serine protease
MSPKALSILNILAFTLNTLETAGVGPFSIHFNQNQDNATISAKYQTIITPHGIAFSIWGIIFLMEAIFCAVTLFNERMGRSRLVVEGVSIWFVLGTYCLWILHQIIAQGAANILT